MVSAYSYAQLPETGGKESRVGVKDPSKVLDLHHKVFESAPFYTPKRELLYSDYMAYYESFKKLMDAAPYVDWNFYGGKMFDEIRSDLGHRTIYESMLDSIPDLAIRTVLVEDFLALARNMVDHLDSINVVRNNRNTDIKAADDTLSLPVAMTKYAHLYYKYAGNPKYYPAHLYDKVQARENYRKAFRMLVDNNIDPGDELEAFYVREYYLACEDLYKSDKEKYYEQFLQDYLEIVESCDNLLLPYIDNIKPKDAKYDQYKLITDQDRRVPVSDTIINGQRVVSKDSIIIPYGIKKLFPLTGASNPDHMSKYYLGKLASHRNDQDYMEKALYVMNELGSSRTEAFYSFSDASYAIKPTYLNCLGCAFSSKECGMQEDMHEFYRQAVSLTQDSLERGLVYYYISDGIEPVKSPGGRESEEFLNWDEEMSVAVNYLDKVVKLSSYFLKNKKLELRELPSRSAYKIHQIRYWMAHGQRDVAQCDEAIQYIYMCNELFPGLFGNLNGAIKRVNDLRKAISTIKPKPTPRTTGPRMSDKNQQDMYDAARIATEEIFDLGKKADTSKLKAYDDWWQTYKNSPDLTEKHKSDRRKYENVKKKYFD